MEYLEEEKINNLVLNEDILKDNKSLFSQEEEPKIKNAIENISDNISN